MKNLDELLNHPRLRKIQYKKKALEWSWVAAFYGEEFTEKGRKMRRPDHKVFAKSLDELWQSPDIPEYERLDADTIVT